LYGQSLTVGQHHDSYPLTQSVSVDEDQQERGFEAIDDSSMNDQIKPRTESGLWGYLA
jgi:hypothetical protein